MKPVPRSKASAPHGAASASSHDDRGAPSGGPRRDDALLPGTRIEEFEIERVLSTSSFGLVYLAVDRAFERRVAIKEYLPDTLAVRGQDGVQVRLRADTHADAFERGRKAFAEAAELLARLDHPSLVRVLRHWDGNGTAYRAMPYYPGTPLLRLREAMGTSPDEATLRALLDGLLEPLDLLHRAGCIHREISPTTILLLPDDRPVLMDWSAARGAIVGGQARALMTLLAPSFAPLEVTAPAPERPVGAWTDLYSLAAVVRYCISGQLPPPAALRTMPADEPIGRMLARMRHVSPGLHYSASFIAAIDAALMPRPEDRPQNVAELRALLDDHPAAVGDRADSQPVEAPAAAAAPSDEDAWRVTQLDPGPYHPAEDDAASGPAFAAGAAGAAVPPDAGAAAGDAPPHAPDAAPPQERAGSAWMATVVQRPARSAGPADEGGPARPGRSPGESWAPAAEPGSAWTARTEAPERGAESPLPAETAQPAEAPVRADATAPAEAPVRADATAPAETPVRAAAAAPAGAPAQAESPLPAAEASVPVEAARRVERPAPPEIAAHAETLVRPPLPPQHVEPMQEEPSLRAGVPMPAGPPARAEPPLHPQPPPRTATAEPARPSFEAGTGGTADAARDARTPREPAWPDGRPSGGSAWGEPSSGEMREPLIDELHEPGLGEPPPEPMWARPGDYRTEERVAGAAYAVREGSRRRSRRVAAVAAAVAALAVGAGAWWLNEHRSDVDAQSAFARVARDAGLPGAVPAVPQATTAPAAVTPKAAAPAPADAAGVAPARSPAAAVAGVPADIAVPRERAAGSTEEPGGTAVAPAPAMATAASAGRAMAPLPAPADPPVALTAAPRATAAAPPVTTAAAEVDEPAEASPRRGSSAARRAAANGARPSVSTSGTRAPATAVATAKTALPARPAAQGPREVCGTRTQFSLYRCVQAQCEQAQWFMHPTCKRLRLRDEVD